MILTYSFFLLSLLASGLVVAASMLSSRISRREDRVEQWEDLVKVEEVAVTPLLITPTSNS